MTALRILIGCETSGVMRRAFAARGHDVWSVDLLPADDGSNRHIVGDVRDYLDHGWDLLAVMHPPCFVGDTLVLTSKGHKPIRDVRVGDEVLTHKGRWRKVKEVMVKTTTRLTCIKSTNGLKTYTTPEHPYYVRYREPYRNGFRTKAERDRPPEFVPSGDLTTRHFTGSVLPPTQAVDIPDEDLWLMGRYVADGHLRESRWTPGKFEEMAISIGLEKLETFKDRVTRKARYSETRTAARATFYGHDAIVPFAQFGRGAENKILPKWVLSLPVEQARIFLDGYLSGDGYVRAKSISACTVSAKLALGIALLMQRVFGKCPAIRTSGPRPLVSIEGREVETLPLHHVEVPQSDKRLRNYVAEDYAWGHVREVTAVTRDALVFNLSVEEDETYTANGLVVHNCTRLCNSGVRWLHVPPLGRTKAEMWQELEDGAALFAACWKAPIERVAVENPIMHRHAKALMPDCLPKPQTVQPWWFGEPYFKATGFYLRGLPPLVETDRLTPPKAGTEAHKRWSAVHRAPPGPDRWRLRSRTFDGIAQAAADQWGGYAMDKAA